MFSTIFASLFGRRNLGKIQAVLVATNLVGVACGPLLINAGHALRGSYDGLFAGIGCLQLLFFTGLCFLKAPLNPGGCGGGEGAGGRGGTVGGGGRRARLTPLASHDEVRLQVEGGGEVWEKEEEGGGESV